MTTTSSTVTLNIKNVVLGTTLAIIGNIVIAFAFNIQKYALREISANKKDVDETNSEQTNPEADFSTQAAPINKEKSSASPVNSTPSNSEKKLTDYFPFNIPFYIASQPYMQSWKWYCGTFLLIFGEFFNLAAYGFAPATLVAVLGTFSIAANMILAIFFLKEKCRIEDIVACSFIVLGAILLVTFSDKDTSVFDTHELLIALIQPTFIVYLVFLIGGIAVSCILIFSYGRRELLLGAFAAACFGTVTVLSAKAVSGLLRLTFSGNIQIASALFWIALILLCLGAVFQVLCMNVVLERYESTSTVAVSYVLFTIGAISSAVVFYRELWTVSTIDLLIFLMGCGLSYLGVIMLTSAASYLRGAEELCPSSDSNGAPPDEKKPLLDGAHRGAPDGGSASASSAPRMSAGGGSRAGSRPPSSREIGSDTRSTGQPSSSEFKSDSARSSTRSGPPQQTATRSEQIAFGRKLDEPDPESESDLDAGVFLSDWSESEAIPPGPFQAPRNGFTSPIANAPLSYALVQPVNRLSPDDKRHFLTQKLSSPQRASPHVLLDLPIFHH